MISLSYLPKIINAQDGNVFFIGDPVNSSSENAKLSIPCLTMGCSAVGQEENLYFCEKCYKTYSDKGTPRDRGFPH